MCFCTPEIRTPFCGKPECKSPADVPGADAWMEAMSSGTLNMAEMDELAKKSQHLYAKYERAKKLSSKRYEAYEKVEAAIMTALKNAGKSKYHVDGLGTVYLIQKTSVRVPSTIEQKKEFFKYLRLKGEDVLFGMTTVNSQTLNSWYNRELDEASARGELGFQVPGIDEPVMRESMGFKKEAKKGK